MKASLCCALVTLLLPLAASASKYDDDLAPIVSRAPAAAAPAAKAEKAERIEKPVATADASTAKKAKSSGPSWLAHH
jgi:hypothetical protein